MLHLCPHQERATERNAQCEAREFTSLALQGRSRNSRSLLTKSAQDSLSSADSLDSHDEDTLQELLDPEVIPWFLPRVCYLCCFTTTGISSLTLNIRKKSCKSFQHDVMLITDCIVTCRIHKKRNSGVEMWLYTSEEHFFLGWAFGILTGLQRQRNSWQATF